jgi:hypothetical protein
MISVFICGLCNDAVSASDYVLLHDRMINELWIGRDVEGHSHGLIQDAIQAFTLSDWGKPQKSVMIADLIQLFKGY